MRTQITHLSPKEAISDIIELRGKLQRYGMTVHTVHQESLNAAINALGKQIATEPIEERNADMTNGWYVCSVCHRMTIEIIDHCYKYCCYCGQKLRGDEE